jgi:hypothetical protein
MIPSPPLFGFPFNLLTDNEGNPILATKSISIAPSAAWLTETRQKPRLRNQRLRCWLGGTSPNLTLQIARSTLTPIIMNHHIEEIISDSPSGQLAGCDLAIVLSHGGIGLQGYFNSVDNRVAEHSPEQFASEFHDVGCVVLFICSAGVTHQQQNTTEALGLVASILKKGSRSVLACPWPLTIDLVPIWLAAFLDQALGGQPVATAARLAAETIKALYPNPAAWAVMHVYGDGTYHVIQ